MFVWEKDSLTCTHTHAFFFLSLSLLFLSCNMYESNDVVVIIVCCGCVERAVLLWWLFAIKYDNNIVTVMVFS